MAADVRCAVLTISDRSAQGSREDLSGPALAEIVKREGWQVVRSAVIPDDQAGVEARLSQWADAGDVDVILTTGGTGFGSRDHAPEATRAVVDRFAPGLAEAIRAASLRKTPHAMLSRGAAGIRRRTLIVNLPGSPRAAKESLEVILPALPHAAELLRGEASAEEGHVRRPPQTHA
ncbi:MAG TPA: MogA/MoaB family molybdenum cofactor biosynthesis protein [Anaerolineales bacterium]